MSPLGQGFTERRELLDAVVVAICHIHIAGIINCKTGWPTEDGALLPSPLGERLAGRSQLLNPLVLRICHVDVACAIHSNPGRVSELPGARALGSPLRESLSRGGKLLDAIVVGV